MAIPPLWCATGQPATPTRTDRGRPDVGTRNCKLPHPKKLQPKLEPRCFRRKPFFALHTHRSGRTASDSRSRLFPATQLVAMHSLKSSCRSASPKKPQKPNHNRTTGTTTETAQQPQPQQQQQNNRNPATTTTRNNKTRNKSDNRRRTTTTNETGGRQQHQQQRTNTAPKRERGNPEQTPKQLHT